MDILNLANFTLKRIDSPDITDLYILKPFKVKPDSRELVADFKKGGQKL